MKNYWYFVVGSIITIVLAFLFNPNFVAKYFSPDHSLGEETIIRVYWIRNFFVSLGILMFVWAVLGKRINKIIKSNYRLINKLLVYLFILGLFIYFSFYLFVVYKRLVYPSFAGDWGEKSLFVESVNYYKGHSSYVDPEIAPLQLDYGPVHPLICAMIMKVVGIHVWVTKGISILASLGIGILMYLIVFRATGNIQSGLISSLLFFACYKYSGYWYDMGRIDTMFVFWVLLGVWLISKSISINTIFLAIFIFSLAFFTKITAIFILPAIFFYLVILNWKKGLLFLLSITSFWTLMILLINSFTNNWYWLKTFKHTTTYIFDYVYGINRFMFILSGLIIIIISVIFGTYLVFKNKVNDSKYLLWLFSLISAFILGISSLANRAINYNHMILSVVFLCILFGISYNWTLKYFEKNNMIPYIIFYKIVLILSLIAMFYNPHKVCQYAKEEVKNIKNLMNYVSSIKGYVYLPDNQDIAALAGKETYDEAPRLADYTAGGHGFPKRFLKLMQNAYFDEIIVRENAEPFTSIWFEKFTWPNEFKKAFYENYTKAKKKWGWVFYERKDPSQIIR